MPPGPLATNTSLFPSAEEAMPPHFTPSRGVLFDVQVFPQFVEQMNTLSLTAAMFIPSADKQKAIHAWLVGALAWTQKVPALVEM